jgi:hypothetical protein
MIPHEGEGVLDLVNDARGEGSNRGHPFRQDETLLELVLGGHVGNRHECPLEAPVFVFDEPPVRADIARLARAGHDRGL